MTGFACLIRVIRVIRGCPSVLVLVRIATTPNNTRQAPFPGNLGHLGNPDLRSKTWTVTPSIRLQLISRNRPDVVVNWSDEEVVRRMLRIHWLTCTLGGDCQPLSELEVRMAMADSERVACSRPRLEDISSSMASLVECVARRCNREHGVKGTFWKDRFGSRSLVDESVILVCSIDIDQNPIRAGEVQRAGRGQTHISLQSHAGRLPSPQTADPLIETSPISQA